MLLGAPGAGKGTQAERISERLHIPAISTGALFRAAVEAGSPLGLQVKAILDKGDLVPDEITLEVLRERILQPDCAGGYILDGVPRTIAQAEGLAALGIEIDACLFFEVSDEAVIARLSGRRMCPPCNKAYHITANPPKRHGACDLCGGDLITRSDDEAETIQRRLDAFRAQTAPLAEFYRKAGKLHVVPSTGSVDETTVEVWTALGLQ